MPKPFKLFSARPLPVDADIIDYEGRPHVRIRDGRGRLMLCRLSKDGRSYLRPSKCWYFKYRDRHGTLRRVKGFADLKATEQFAAETERKVARQRAGLIDPAEEHASRPLADYGRHLGAKGDTPAHVALTIARISAVVEGCGFAFLCDFDTGKVSAWLAALRRGGTVVAVPPGEAFSASAVARLVGLTVAAIRQFVARHRLPIVGSGRNRRLTREAVERIVAERAKGVSPATVNHYVRALRGFTRWLVKSKRLGSDPLEMLSPLNVAVDVRRRRRELDAAELRRLLEVTRASDRTFRGLAGFDRYCLYLTAASTGIRAKSYRTKPLASCRMKITQAAS
jgi:predicted transcriptional regulator